MANEADTCEFCRHTIVWMSGAWIHTVSHSMFCDLQKRPGGTIARPVKRTDRAEQQQLAFI